jgi:hypothetical protein
VFSVSAANSTNFANCNNNGNANNNNASNVYGCAPDSVRSIKEGSFVILRSQHRRRKRPVGCLPANISLDMSGRMTLLAWLKKLRYFSFMSGDITRHITQKTLPYGEGMPYKAFFANFLMRIFDEQ